MKMNFFRTMVLLAVIFTLIIALSIHNSINFDLSTEEAPNSSTFSTQPTGLKALYLTGKQLQLDVKRWIHPFQLLPKDSVGTIVSYLPSEKFTDKEKKIIQAWLDDGGRFIILENEKWLKDNSVEEAFDIHEDLEIWHAANLVNNEGLKSHKNGSLSAVADLFNGPEPIYFDDYHNGIKNKRSFSLLALGFMRYPWGQFCLTGLVALLVGLFGCRLRIDRHCNNLSKSLPSQRQYPSRVDSLTTLFRYINSKELSSDIARNYLQFKGKLNGKLK